MAFTIRALDIKSALSSIAIAAAFMAAASPVYSQAPIVDLSGEQTGQSADTSAPAYSDSGSRGDARVARVSPSAAQRNAAQRNAAQRNAAQSSSQGGGQADAYYQMQVLQQEVRELRGTVEELRHEVERLKQQRIDDYMDLDRRIARLSGNEPAEQPPEGEGTADDEDSGATGSSPAASAASADERERYQTSFGMAREGDYDGASAEFKRLLQDYPDGHYAPNANYWLGEIALVQGNLEEARQWFAALLDGYPNSSKVWDGRYKLGTVYYQLGDQQRARDLLEQVADSDARASGLAKKYLEDNF